MRWVGVVAAAVLMAVVLIDAFEVVLLPRRDSAWLSAVPPVLSHILDDRTARRRGSCRTAGGARDS